MEFGYAMLDITPAPGEEMAGYGYWLNRRAIGTMDALMARALAFSDGEAKGVVVQLDLLGLAKDFVADVRAEVERRHGVAQDHLMLHCTHTHTGPATMPLYGCGMPSEHFLFTLREQILSVVGQALEGMSPATRLETFEGDFSDGFAWNRVEGPDLDTRVRGLRIDCEHGAPIVVASYACHPVTIGLAREYSADYPGALVRELTAYGMRALFLNGCCGDINPLTHRVQWGCGTRETLLIYGRDLAAAVRRAMSNAKQWRPGPIRALSRMVPLDAPDPDPQTLRCQLQRHRAALAQNPLDHATRMEVSWHEHILELQETGRLNVAREAEIQAIACGDVVFVGLSAETFTRMGQIIRQAAPNRHLMITATSNGVLGYIADRRDVEQRGYASSSACKIYGMLLPAPGAGEKWAEEGAKVVREVIERGT